MTCKYILHAKSPICQAMRHVLEVFAVPTDHIISEGDHFAVMDGHNVHIGILPLLASLRSSTSDASLLAFAGADAEVRPLVNQWVSVSSLLSSDVTLQLRGAGGACTPLAKHVFAEIEQHIESGNLQKSFLAGTPRATVADVLLYAAIHGHPNGEAYTRQSTLSWSLFAQNDERLAPILSESAAAKAATLAKTTVTPAYVKPSEEEILRRRQEKERAKAAKAATGDKDPKQQQRPQQQQQQQNKKKEGVVLDPSRLDIRVGRFTNVKVHPDADRLYIEEMDIGAEKRTIVSGLVQHYKLEELEGKLCFAVCNMKPKPLKGVTSFGMVLCASNEHTLSLVPPPDGAQPGDRVVFGDCFDPEKLKADFPPQLSSNAMGELIESLRTDSDGVVRWKDTPAHHANGVVKISTITNGIVR